MGWLITFGILFLLAILPLGASVKYDEDGAVVNVIAGPVKITLFPRPKKEKNQNPPNSAMTLFGNGSAVRIVKSTNPTRYSAKIRTSSFLLVSLLGIRTGFIAANLTAGERIATGASALAMTRVN